MKWRISGQGYKLWSGLQDSYSSKPAASTMQKINPVACFNLCHWRFVYVHLFEENHQNRFSRAGEKTRGGEEGNSWYFRTGVCHYKISISTLSGIFDEKVGPFSEFLCLMEVSKVRFWGLFWEKMASIFKKFSKNCGVLSKLGQRNQSIQSSFGLSFVSSK